MGLMQDKAEAEVGSTCSNLLIGSLGGIPHSSNTSLLCIILGTTAHRDPSSCDSVLSWHYKGATDLYTSEEEYRCEITFSQSPHFRSASRPTVCRHLMKPPSWMTA